MTAALEGRQIVTKYRGDTRTRSLDEVFRLLEHLACIETCPGHLRQGIEQDTQCTVAQSRMMEVARPALEAAHQIVSHARQMLRHQ